MHSQLNLSSVLNRGVEGPACLTFPTKMSLVVPFFGLSCASWVFPCCHFSLVVSHYFELTQISPFIFLPLVLCYFSCSLAAFYGAFGHRWKENEMFVAFLTSTRRRHEFALNKSSACICTSISLHPFVPFCVSDKGNYCLHKQHNASLLKWIHSWESPGTSWSCLENQGRTCECIYNWLESISLSFSFQSASEQPSLL